MKKNLKFMKYATFCVISLFMTSLAFTGCKNYDEDVSRIDSEIAALKASVSSVTSSVDGVKSDLSAAKTDLQNQVTAAKTAADAAKVAADAAKVAGDAAKAAAEEAKAAAEEAKAAAAQAKLDAIAEAEKMFSALEGEIDILKEQIADNADFDALKKEFEALKKKVDDAIAGVSDLTPVNSMITDITAVIIDDGYWPVYGDSSNDQQLFFNSTLAKINYTFGTGLKGAVTFEKDKAPESAFRTFYVKVNPSNAVLTADKVFFMDSKGNTDVNDFLNISVERYDGLITKTPENGIWQVEVELKKEVVEKDFLAAVYTAENNPRRIAYTFGVENKVEDGDDALRYAVSEYIYSFDVYKTDPVYNWQDYGSTKLTNEELNFTVDGIWYGDIYNRYNNAEDGTATPKRDQKWGNATGTYGLNTNGSYNTAADPDDNRNGKAILPVTVGKEFKVEILTEEIYKYYVTLDSGNAVESTPSEINAWNSYTYTGLNEVKDASEPIAINVTSTSAVGDIVGFRVFAVNYDGTLVDPDGKAFYVIVSPQTSASALNFTVTVDTYRAAETEQIALTLPAGITAANITSATLSLRIENNTAVNSFDLIDAAGNAGSTWANAKKIILEGIDARRLLDNGKVYSGILSLTRTLNGVTVPYGTINVTLTKKMPTFDGNVTYKTGMPTINGVCYAYPIINGAGTHGTFDMNSLFNGLNPAMTFADNSGTLATGRVKPTYAGHIATIAIAEIGVADLLVDPAANRTAAIQYGAKLSQTYVNYSSSTTAPNVTVSWSANPAIKVEFRSFVQDFTINWKPNGGTQAAPIVYLPTLYYNAQGGNTPTPAANIKIQPAVGSAFDLGFGPQTYTGPNGETRTYTVVGLTALSGANFAIENEYFAPTINGANIEWNNVPNAGAPSIDVPHKLKVRIQDEFGKEYEFILNTQFLMKKQQP